MIYTCLCLPLLRLRFPPLITISEINNSDFFFLVQRAYFNIFVNVFQNTECQCIRLLNHIHTYFLYILPYITRRKKPFSNVGFRTNVRNGRLAQLMILFRINLTPVVENLFNKIIIIFLLINSYYNLHDDTSTLNVFLFLVFDRIPIDF